MLDPLASPSRVLERVSEEHQQVAERVRVGHLGAPKGLAPVRCLVPTQPSEESFCVARHMVLELK